MQGRKGALLCLLAGTLAGENRLAQADEAATGGLDSPRISLWKDAIGEGFTRGAREIDVSGGAGIGLKVMGSSQRHDWVIGSADYGWIFTDLVGAGHWYQGNGELLGQVFGGEQFHPDHAYFVGVAPHLRYNLATGTRFVPFADVGAGATATDIRNGDLSTPFEFNLQGGLGLRYFVLDNLALTFQWRYIHFSNAGMKVPNLGVNNSTFLLGMAWMY